MRFFPFVPLRVRMTVSVVLWLPDPYHGKSNAYFIMNLIDFFKFLRLPPLPRRGIEGGTFSAWQIELTTRCPLRCGMCLREGVDHWYSSDMKIENFRKLIPYLREAETVILEGWGESLLHRNLIEIIRLVKAEGPQVGFVTSGKGLTGEYISEIIDAGIDFIGFSLSGTISKTHNAIRVHSDHEALINDIRTFNKIKRGKRSEKPRLHIVYLMLKDNISEVTSLMELAKDIGIDEVVLTNLIHVANEWQEGQRVFRCIPPVSPLSKGGIEGGYEDILKEVEIKAKESKINLRRPSLSPEDVPVCEENPLRNLYISVDGEVSPCVYLYPPVPSPFKRIFCGNEYQLEKVSFGNIFREPFHEIWGSKRYTEFRECFIKRKRRFEEMYSFLLDLDGIKRFEIMPLPDPPDQCKTCHKILGV
jgi:MoaA/NifB/PqqE/SkfB family radical SAM enzyme